MFKNSKKSVFMHNIQRILRIFAKEMKKDAQMTRQTHELRKEKLY